MAKTAEITQKDLDKLKKEILKENTRTLEDFAKKIDKINENARKLIDELHAEQDKRLVKLEQSIGTHGTDLGSRLKALERAA